MSQFDLRIGDQPATVIAPEPGTFRDDAFQAAFPSGGFYGLDVETSAGTKVAQWDGGFSIRLLQIATVEYSWVLDFSDPVQKAAAQRLLGDSTTWFCSHSDYDVMSVKVALGVDISMRNVDTWMLASLVGIGQGNAGLKDLTDTFLGPELSEADQEVDAEFLRLYRQANPPGLRKDGKPKAEARPAKEALQTFGWNAIPTRNEMYLRYAGLDAIACRRLVEKMTEMATCPDRLVKTEVWLSGAANRIRMRGMKADQDRLRSEYDAAKAITEEAATKVKELSGILVGSVKLADWFAEHGADFSNHPKTDTGKPSFSKDDAKLLLGYEMDDVAMEVAQQLLVHKGSLNALRTTEQIIDRIDPQGFIHPRLNTMGAITGRMSSSGPNVQNFSKKNPKMRGMFLPADGHVLVTADFDQIELRVVAALAKEQKMLDTILAGGDLHTLTADEVGIDRDLAKMTNFLIVYGGGANALHDQGGIPLEQAREVVQTFRDRYPAIADLTREMASFKESIRTISHRRVPVKLDKTGGNKSYANINYLVQSSARELLVDAWMRFDLEFGHGDWVWLPIHDEIVMQVPETQVDEAIRDIEKCMTFDFYGVPISASAIILRDTDGKSRWMTSKYAEKCLVKSDS